MTDRQSEAYEADREDEAREREQIRRERFGVLPPRDATKRARVTVERAEAGGHVIESGTYTVDMPADYDPDWVTGEDILMDGAMCVVHDPMDTTRHEARIHEMDRDLAPGSETALLGDALRSIRSSSHPRADLAWWVGAYRLLEWGTANPERFDRDVGRGVWDSPAEMILSSGECMAGWTPPPPTPDDLRAWREAEGLTQERAGHVAGVKRLAWARWEGGTRGVPQWLADTLLQRWGSAP